MELESENERLRMLLARYVSAPVASEVFEQGIVLGGAPVYASAMFVDLYGFTALTRRLPAARVVELLNEYYAIVERACAEQAGMITQFIGDGAVAVFGGPLKPLADHARRAVLAAIVLQRALAERNAAGDERLEAGIGICTGEMIAGNVGAGERVTYTVVGDAVNQASRVQAMTRAHDATILLTASTRAGVGSLDDTPLRSCGTATLKGIDTSIALYAVDLR